MGKNAHGIRLALYCIERMNIQMRIINYNSILRNLQSTHFLMLIIFIPRFNIFIHIFIRNISITFF